ncbi:MAG: hypothetical protein IJQ21_04670 [Lachnospiraceae bacterium]|nr:hypothetical protein [Lachnospiraceae bacterium]
MIALICGVILLFYIRFDQVAYSTDDTVQMNLIASGAFAPHSQYLIYSNILYGIALKYLYLLIPSVNWYLFCGLFANLCAVISVCCLLCRRLETVSAVPVTLIVMLFFSGNFFLSVHYTTNGFLLAVAGYFWLLHYHGHPRKRFLVPAVLFLTLSSMSRLSAFLVTIPLFCAVFAVRLFFRRAMFPDKKQRAKQAALMLLPFVIALATALPDRYAYAKDPNWSSYQERNTIRMEIQDRGFLNYPEYKALYDEAGIPMSAINLITRWLDNDPEVYSREGLRRIADIKRGYDPISFRLDVSLLARSVHGVLSRFFFGQTLFPWLFVAEIIALLFRKDKERLWMMLLISGLVFAIYYALYCYGRLGIHVEAGIWLTAFMLPFGDFPASQPAEEKTEDNAEDHRKNLTLLRTAGAVFSVLLALLCAVPVIDDPQGARLVSPPEPVNNAALAHTALEYLRSDKAHFYVVGSLLGKGYWGAASVYDINGLHTDDYENICFLGGWFAASPVGMYHAYEKGITNPVRALFEREDTLLAAPDEEAEWIWYFLIENYRPDIAYRKVNDNIWQFYIPSD